MIQCHLNLGFKIPGILPKIPCFVHCVLSPLGPSNVFKIVKMIMEKNFQPVIIFSFSKKECEAYALQVSKLDFNTGSYSLDDCPNENSLEHTIAMRFAEENR